MPRDYNLRLVWFDNRWMSTQEASEESLIPKSTINKRCCIQEKLGVIDYKAVFKGAATVNKHGHRLKDAAIVLKVKPSLMRLMTKAFNKITPKMPKENMRRFA